MNTIAGESAENVARHAGQVVRFLLVGAINALATYGLFLIFLWILGLHYMVSNLLAFATWAWFGYEMQRRVVFRVDGSSRVFTRYLANQILFLVGGTGILAVLVDIAGFFPSIAYILMLAVVTTGMYLTSKLLVFSSSSRH